MLCSCLNILCRPVAVAHIIKALELLHDFSITIAVHIKEADRHSCKLGTGNLLVRRKNSLAVAIGHTVVVQVFHIAAVPRIRRHITELGLCHRGNAVPILICQQSCKNRRCFASSHVAFRSERTVRIANDISAVMFRFLDFGNRNLTVLISLAGGLIA